MLISPDGWGGGREVTGVPHPVLDRGDTLIQTWIVGVGGTCGTPILILDGVPPIWSRDGVPRQQGGVAPLSGTGMGYPPCPDLGCGTAPPPASVNRLKILPSLILRMRAVKMLQASYWQKGSDMKIKFCIASTPLLTFHSEHRVDFPVSGVY